MALKRLTGFDPGAKSIRALSLIVTYGLLANLFFLACEVFVVFYAQIPEHVDHFKYLYRGLDGGLALVPWMNISLIAMLCAQVLLLIPSVRNRPDGLAAACVLVFAGIWIDKGLGLVTGGFVPNPLHEVVEYTPTLPELLISLGVYGIGGLCLTMLLKIAVSVKRETGMISGGNPGTNRIRE